MLNGLSGSSYSGGQTRSTFVRLCPAFFFWVFRVNGAAETAAGRKRAGHHGPFGPTGFHEVLQDPVDGVFVKDAEVPIGVNVEFQRFEFDARFEGHVMNGNGAEVRESGFGTDRGVFRNLDRDLIPGKLIGPGFNCRQGRL